MELSSFRLNSPKVCISSVPLDRCFGWGKNFPISQKKSTVLLNIFLDVPCPGLKPCLLFVFNASLKSEGLCFIADCIKAKHQYRRDRITTIKRKEQAPEASPSTASSLHGRKRTLGIARCLAKLQKINAKLHHLR